MGNLAFDTSDSQTTIAPDIEASPAGLISPHPMSGALKRTEHSEADLIIGHGEAQRVGRFRIFVEDQRWEWSDAVARMHGYEPGTVVPTTELLLQHKHPDDRPQVTAALERVLLGEPFSSRHRIIDTAGHTTHQTTRSDP